MSMSSFEKWDDVVLTECIGSDDNVEELAKMEAKKLMDEQPYEDVPVMRSVC